MTSITLFKGSGKDREFWLARWSGEGVQKILELFDTDTLPTAFGRNVPAQTVLATISRLNPQATVYLEPREVRCSTDGRR